MVGSKGEAGPTRLYSNDGKTLVAFWNKPQQTDFGENVIPMTMEDWARRLDMFLEFDDQEILRDAGKVTANLAKAHAESEFEKYRIVQDHQFESDFDREIKRLEQKNDEE